MVFVVFGVSLSAFAQDKSIDPASPQSTTQARTQDQQVGDQDQNAQQPTDQKPAPLDASVNSVPDVSTTDVSQIPRNFQVTKLGSAQWLEPNVHSLLHLGPLYVGSVSAFFLAGTSQQFNAAQAQTVSGFDYFGVIRTDVTYDKITRLGRFTFQYLPEVALNNGVVETNFSNQSLTFSMAHAINARWTLGVSNSLSYINGHVLYGELSLDVNSVSGGGVQNPFLQTTQRWLSDSTSANANYQINARDTLTLTGNFNYSESNLSTLARNSYGYGGTVGWNHALSQTKSVGIFGQLQEVQYSSMFPATLYKGFGGNFSDRLSPTLVVTITGGISLGNNGAAPGQDKQFNVTGTGTASIRKDFQNSSVAADVYRSTSTGPFLTNGYTDRIDATYSRNIGRRMLVSGGAAYQQDSFSGGKISGTYATADMSYLVTRSLSWFSAYARRWQSQSEQILGTGQIPSNTFTTGITYNLTRSNVISPTISY